MSYDSFASLRQNLGLAAYDNRMPYWFTKTVGFFFQIGYSLFGEINAALAFYVVCQILFIAACFSYTLVTMYQAGIPNWALGIGLFLYGLLPYNIKFNITVGKDILFGVGGLLMITALYRILKKIGKSQLGNYIVFIVGSLCFSLWRTNGWYAYAVTAVVMLILLRKQYKKLLAVMGIMTVLCWLLLNPYFVAKGIEGTDYIEAMAIPFQQVAQVVANDREISQEDEALLSESFDLEMVKELYTPGHVDVIKYDALRDREFFLGHLGEYTALWVRLGLKYPGEYVSAWIDQTKGYWNSGYHVGVNDLGIAENELGIVYTGGDNGIARAFDSYYSFFDRAEILEPLKASGFVVWLVIGCLIINAAQKREEFLLAIPSLVLIVGLWFGTPVAAEFRYSYPMFVVSPLLIATTLFEKRKNG